VGYTPVRNVAARSDGLWKVYDKRQAIYVEVELPLNERLAAASDLVCGPAEADSAVLKSV
jgi:hypothetical protein